MVLCLMPFELNRVGFKEDDASANPHIFQQDLSAGSIKSLIFAQLTNTYLVSQWSDT